jgi:hypothetical protein
VLAQMLNGCPRYFLAGYVGRLGHIHTSQRSKMAFRAIFRIYAIDNSETGHLRRGAGPHFLAVGINPLSTQ